jgi:hypothetical protein
MAARGRTVNVTKVGSSPGWSNWSSHPPAAGVERALRQAIRTLPDELRRSLTREHGKEMAHYA